MNESEFTQLSAGHALNALSVDDEAQYESALREHPEWSQVAVIDIETAALFAEGHDEVAPPPELRASILSLIAQEAQTAPATDATVAPADEAPANDSDAAPDDARALTEATAQPKKRSMTRGMLALAACLVLLVAVGVGSMVTLNQSTAPVSPAQALEQITESSDAKRADGSTADGGIVTAYWSDKESTAVLVTANLPELDEDSSYEIWVIRGDADPIPAGIFSARDGDKTAVITEPVHEGDIIAVTHEAAGGSKTGKPTTDPLFTIATSA